MTAASDPSKATAGAADGTLAGKAASVAAVTANGAVAGVELSGTALAVDGAVGVPKSAVLISDDGMALPEVAAAGAGAADCVNGSAVAPASGASRK